MTDYARQANVLYWGGDGPGNFGDRLTEYLLRHALLGPREIFARYRLIGSIIDPENLGRDLSTLGPDDRIAYWGCGARDAVRPAPELLARCEFFSVRGPLTRELLGIAADVPLGDPGLLLPLLIPASKASRKQTVCIPHYYETRTDAELLAGTGAERILHPRVGGDLAEVERLARAISGASFVLAGSLHAAIVAHAYGTPYAFLDAGYVDIPFKWRDFAASVGIPAMFVDNVADGRRVHAEFIAPRAKAVALLPIIAACPFHVRPSALAAAARADGLAEVDPALIDALRRSAVESPRRVARSMGLAARVCSVRDASLAQIVELRDQLARATAASQGLAEQMQGLEAKAEQLAGVRAELEAARAEAAGLARALAEEAEWRRGLESVVIDARARLQEAEGARERAVEIGVELAAERDQLAGRIAEAEARLVESQSRLAETTDKLGQVLAESAAAGQQRADLERRLDAAEQNAAEAGLRLGAAEAERDGLIASAAALQQRLDEAVAEHDRLNRDREQTHAAVVAAGRSQLEQAHGQLEQAQSTGAELRTELDRADRELARLRHEIGVLGDAGKARRGAGLAFRWRLSRARSAARAANWAAATVQYAWLISEHPGSAALLAQYGHALKQAGRSSDAALVYARALRLGGGPLDLEDHLVEVAGSIDAARDISELPLDAVEAARALLDAGMAGQLKRTPPGRLSPGQQLQVSAARRSARARAWAPAQEHYEKVLRSGQGRARDWKQLGHALKEQSRLERAITAYLEAIRLDPATGDNWVQLGHALKQASHPELAREAYGVGFVLDAWSGEAERELTALGATLQDLIELLVASEVRLAATRRPLLASRLGLSLARSAARQRQWRTARRLYAWVLSADPGLDAAWVQLGHACKETGDLSAARRAYFTALSLSPDLADTHLQLGHLLKLDGRLAEAIAAYERANALNPALSDARNELRSAGVIDPRQRRHASRRSHGEQAETAPASPPAVSRPPTSRSRAPAPRSARSAPLPPAGLTRRQSAIWSQLRRQLARETRD